MCSDDYIDRAGFKPRNYLVDLACAFEARERFDLHWPVRESIQKSLIVLLRQQGRRNEYDDLRAGLNGDECGAQGHFRFAEADIAADDSIHRFVVLEIARDLFDRLRLVRRFFKRKTRRKRAQI